MLNKHVLAYVLAILSACASLASAQLPFKKANKAHVDLIFGDNKGSELQIQAKQMPMADVIDSIAGKTNVPIHYSVLPEGLVTATCVGESLKPVLDCLLNKKADVIVRYPRNNENGTDKAKIAEAWILGSRLDGVPAKVDCAVPAGNGKGSLAINQNGQRAVDKRIKELLELAESSEAEERTEAMGSLLATGRKGDPEIKAALENGLRDKNANVRAQAISTLAHLEGNDALPEIREAMGDSSVDVRMMAVDGITNDVTLLQQAVNDSDETVRNLAAMKLEEALKELQNNP